MDRVKTVLRSLGVGLVLGMMLAVSACATANKQLVAADATLHSGLAALDDKVHAFCKAPANQPLYSAPCADVNQPMIALLKAGDAFNRGVAAGRITGFGALLSASADVVKAFAKLPEGQTAVWIKELGDLLSMASTQAVK